jgi:AraC-like DNA-binding protein
MSEVAKALAISERTLRRHLKQMSTSYSDILQEVRQDLAKAALIHSDLTIDEIASMLGYTETTNFRHAFRRWVGQSPHSYRQSARSNDNVAPRSRAA